VRAEHHRKRARDIDPGVSEHGPTCDEGSRRCITVT
jgi:hypothetical protein